MSETDVLEGSAVVETATSGRENTDQELPEVCYACGEKVEGAYCYRCGQKNDDCRRSIFSLIAETVTSIVSIDSKFLRTLGTVLIRPGRYVRDYGDGKRSRFTPPIRFFLVISFVFFTLMALTDTYFLTIKPEILPEGVKSRGATATFTDQTGKKNSVEFAVQFFQQPEDIEFSDDDASVLREMLVANFKEALEETDPDTEDISLGEIESLADIINRVAVNPKPFNIALNSWLPRLMFVMTPFMALLGLVFIRGKDAMVYDQLILSLNFHAVMFLSLTLAVIATGLVPGGVITTIFILGMMIYYLLMIKGAYQRGWFKSVAATLFVFIFYSLIMVASLLAISILAIRDIA